MANSVDSDLLASSEANWSGSTLFAKTRHVVFSKRRVKKCVWKGWLANWSGSAQFAIKYLKLYHQSGSSNLIGWKLEMGAASKFIQQDKG